MLIFKKKERRMEEQEKEYPIHDKIIPVTNRRIQREGIVCAQRLNVLSCNQLDHQIVSSQPTNTSWVEKVYQFFDYTKTDSKQSNRPYKLNRCTLSN